MPRRRSRLVPSALDLRAAVSRPRRPRFPKERGQSCGRGCGVSELAQWRSVAEHGPPEPEVYVLCWDGLETFVDWFGGKPDAGRGVTHWSAYAMPPGATSDMHDGRRAFANPLPPESTNG